MDLAGFRGSVSRCRARSLPESGLPDRELRVVDLHLSPPFEHPSRVRVARMMFAVRPGVAWTSELESSLRLVRLCVRRLTRATVAHFIRPAATVVKASHPVVVSNSAVTVTSVIVSPVTAAPVPRFTRASSTVLDT